MNTGDERSPETNRSTFGPFSRPPSFSGVMVVGLPYLGDKVGGVEIWNERGRDLLGVVKRAVKFVVTKI
jgi:hypothetical protein